VCSSDLGEEVGGLTCHQADWHQMGRQAVRTLLKRIDPTKPTDAEQHLFPHQLREGATTARSEL
jgi:DNA-binding LacI/PurR family transcriptional regulator